MNPLAISFIIIFTCMILITISIILADLKNVAVWWMPWNFSDNTLERLCDIKYGKAGWYDDDDLFSILGIMMTFDDLESKGLITVVSSDTDRMIYLTRRGKFVRWYAIHVCGYTVNE